MRLKYDSQMNDGNARGDNVSVDARKNYADNELPILLLLGWDQDYGKDRYTHPDGDESNFKASP